MDAIAFWATPLLLLPGAGLLIISTSARYAQLYGEVTHLLAYDATTAQRLTAHALRRARLFRNALVLLYACAGLFATAGLLGHAFVLETDWALMTVGAITCVGILALAAATAFLIRESLLSVEGLEALARSPAPPTHG